MMALITVKEKNRKPSHHAASSVSPSVGGLDIFVRQQKPSEMLSPSLTLLCLQNLNDHLFPADYAGSGTPF